MSWKLMKKNMAAKEASIVWKCNDYKGKLAEVEPLPEAAFTEMTASLDRLKDEVITFLRVGGHLLLR